MKTHYKKIRKENRDEHRLIMEEYLGRPLEPDEIVHHVDNNKKHNELENLELCLDKVHVSYHHEQGHLHNIGEWSHINNPKPNNHGTRNTYERYGCRFDLCCEAKLQHKLMRKKRKYR